MPIDLMTSPPGSAAASPSLTLLATIPTLIPTYPSPLAIGLRRPSLFTPPPLPLVCPDTGPVMGRASCSEADTAVRETANLEPKQCDPAVQPGMSAPSRFQTVGIGSPVAVSRKPSIKIQLPPVPSCPAIATTTPTHPSTPFTQSEKHAAPRLSFSVDIDENAARRRSSYCRTPYPISPTDEEGADYITAPTIALSRAGDVRSLHVYNQTREKEELTGWTDPCGAVESADKDQLFGALKRGTEGKINERCAARRDVPPSVKAIDVTQWASVGMEHASSVDSQTAIEGDSLLSR